MYNYDRTAAEKTWYDMLEEAEGSFMDQLVKELASRLNGTSTTGAMGSGTVTYSKGKIKLGFKGGGGGMVYVIVPKGKGEKQTEHSVVNHTPKTFANILIVREVIPAP